MRLFKQSHFLKNMVSLNVNNNNNNLFIPLPIKSMRIPSQNKIITKPSPPVLKNANISSYRLGDLILLNISESEKNELSTDYPNSIGSKYLVEKNKNKTKNDYTTNIEIVTKIVLEYIEKNIEYLPKDIENSTVIHLRLGDVIAGNEWHEKTKRPIEVNNIIKLLNDNNDNNDNDDNDDNSNKRYIIGKCFFAKTSSHNYDECIELSNQYLQDVITSLNAEHFDSGIADIDLCCAIKAKLFVQGRGFFSKLIVEIRKKLNLKNIETQCYI
jgi:hypothetical protein